MVSYKKEKRNEGLHAHRGNYKGLLSLVGLCFHGHGAEYRSWWQRIWFFLLPKAVWITWCERAFYIAVRTVSSCYIKLFYHLTMLGPWQEWCPLYLQSDMEINPNKKTWYISSLFTVTKLPVYYLHLLDCIVTFMHSYILWVSLTIQVLFVGTLTNCSLSKLISHP